MAPRAAQAEAAGGIGLSVSIRFNKSWRERVPTVADDNPGEPLDIAAAECGIPLLAVWELITDGALPAVRTELSPGVFQWRCADLAAWRAYAGSRRQAMP